MIQNLLKSLIIVGLLFGGSSVFAQTELKNQIRFKIMRQDRDAQVERFQKVTSGQFEMDQIASVEYEEEDTGFSITDEVSLNSYLGLLVTVGYYGQFRSHIELLDGSQHEITEQVLFGYAGLRLGKTFFKRLSVYGILGYGYYRDRVKGVNPALAELDPPEDPLYKTGNYEDFTPATELGLTYHFTDTLGLTISYEQTEFLDVDQTSWNAGIALAY